MADTLPQRVALAVLTDRADRIERADAALRTELRRWRRPDDDTATDGIAPGVLPELPLAFRTSDVPLRDLPAPGGHGRTDPQRLPLPAERPDLAVLCTRYDGPTSWLQAGQGLARVGLRITELELAASPLGQALDLPWTRQRLRWSWASPSIPQLVLRLGHAPPPGARSPRRPVPRCWSPGVTLRPPRPPCQSGSGHRTCAGEECRVSEAPADGERLSKRCPD